LPQIEVVRVKRESLPTDIAAGINPVAYGSRWDGSCKALC